MTAPTRRRFRWSLRTMFVVVTVFCVWLGWQVNVIRERKSLIQTLYDDPHLAFDPLHTAFGPDAKSAVSFNGSITFRSGTPSVPWFRRLLGDSAIQILGLPSELTESDVRRFKHAFPEALITQEPPGMHFSDPKALKQGGLSASSAPSNRQAQQR